LLSGHAHRLDSKLATTHVKQVFKIGTQKVDREDIV